MEYKYPKYMQFRLDRGRPTNLKDEDIFSYVLGTSMPILNDFQKNGTSGETFKPKLPQFLGQFSLRDLFEVPFF